MDKKEIKTKIKSSTKFKNWFMNQSIKAQWIHQSKQSRNKFKLIYLLIIFILFIGYCGAGALLFIGGLRFYQDGPNSNNPSTDWYAGIKNGWALWSAVTLLIILFIISFLLSLYIPILYKQSRMLYFQTDEYKQNVIKYSNMDLKRYSIKQIKWLKKLGYINSVTYHYYKKPNKK